MIWKDVWNFTGIYVRPDIWLPLAKEAMKLMNLTRSVDEEVVAIVKTIPALSMPSSNAGTVVGKEIWLSEISEECLYGAEPL